MNIRDRCGIGVVAVLLLAGGLFAGQASVQNATAARVISSPGLASPAGPAHQYALSPTYDNDVGVAKIVSPDGDAPFGDRIFPRGRVQNFGTQPQTNIPVICAMYDSATGERVYGPETAYVASLDSGGVRTVDFPFWLPPSQTKVYFDTMATALPGDEDATNDSKGGRFTVSPPGLEYVYIDPGPAEIWCWPWYCVSKMRFQTLYTSSEIGRGGTIHQMALYKNCLGQIFSGTFPNVTVKLCNTTVGSLGSSFSGNYGSDTPVAVFHADYLRRGIIDPNGNSYAWDTIDFTTDFSYDNSKNLLVEITWQGGASGFCYTVAADLSSARMAYNSDADTDTTDDNATPVNCEFNTRIGFKSPAHNVGQNKISR